MINQLLYESKSKSSNIAAKILWFILFANEQRQEYSIGCHEQFAAIVYSDASEVRFERINI